jgi:hypothetical protein
MNKIAKLILIMNKFNTTINFFNYLVLSKRVLYLGTNISWYCSMHTGTWGTDQTSYSILSTIYLKFEIQMNGTHDILQLGSKLISMNINYKAALLFCQAAHDRIGEHWSGLTQ